MFDNSTTYLKRKILLGSIIRKYYFVSLTVELLPFVVIQTSIYIYVILLIFFTMLVSSVDCTHANTGLFLGIFVMVATIISLVVFFVLIDSGHPHLHDMAITIASLTELSLYSLTLVAALVGTCQVSQI